MKGKGGKLLVLTFVSFDLLSAKTSNDRLVALKQSRPCNLWEYYICMEVRCRMKELNEDLVSEKIT